MKKLIQTALLGGYRSIAATGLLETRYGKRLFAAAYDIYKRRLEADDADALQTWVTPGSTAIDVGANIGFFTILFARWVGPSGRVVAVEPETENISMLRQRLEEAGVSGVVDVIEGVAAEQPGTLHLVLNPFHPADHRIGAQGVPVRSWTIDEIMAQFGWPAVSLIKIDVQGSEIRVLRGAQDTIARMHPAFFVEVDDRALGEAGFSADQLFDELERHGYRAYDPASPSTSLTRSKAALHRRALGYADYLFRT